MEEENKRHFYCFAFVYLIFVSVVLFYFCVSTRGHTWCSELTPGFILIPVGLWRPYSMLEIELGLAVCNAKQVTYLLYDCSSPRRMSFVTHLETKMALSTPALCAHLQGWGIICYKYQSIPVNSLQGLPESIQWLFLDLLTNKNRWTGCMGVWSLLSVESCEGGV